MTRAATAIDREGRQHESFSMEKRAKKRELGQFFTPHHVADFMASLFFARMDEVELLDAGAGTGALSAAVFKRFKEGQFKPKRIRVTAYEADMRVIDDLQRTLSDCQKESDLVGIDFSFEILREDFIAAAVATLRSDLFSPKLTPFNLAIVNPPYRKLRTDSPTRRLLRSVGIETSNFYSAFVALILRLLTKGGECVAITPRSFCNGPYFRPFRVELLKSSALQRLHLFESRKAAFQKDDVLQENVIFHVVKGLKQPNKVVISSNSGREDSAITEHKVSYSDVVRRDDPEQFIHINVQSAPDTFRIAKLTASLKDLGLGVSTGRVVDFRASDFLRKDANSDTAPLIYPTHFDGGFVEWPKSASRKPNAIEIHYRTLDLLVPAGVYVLVKRFSSKEERRRIVASIYDPQRIDSHLVGFENHLNYFHVGGNGMLMEIAKGLAVFLNSSYLDRYFRQFSGHTQVNAVDLRNMKYPQLDQLKSIGRQVGSLFPDQQRVDALVEKHILGKYASVRNSD